MNNTFGNPEGTKTFTIYYLEMGLHTSSTLEHSIAPPPPSIQKPETKPMDTHTLSHSCPLESRPVIRSFLNGYNRHYNHLLSVHYSASPVLSTLSTIV